MSGLAGVTAVAAGGMQSFAIKSDGRRYGQAWAWGYNQGNSLGDGLGIDQPIAVHVLDEVKGVFTGDSWSTFYLKAGTAGGSALWGSGNHNAGMLHASGENFTAIPVPVSTGSFVSVAAGAGFRTALRTDGALMNWGNWPAANGLALGDAAWANADHDGDGLVTAREWDLGTDPWNADSNEDGIPDGSAVGVGADPLATDIDLDNVPNAVERAQGTDPFRADTDGDGHPDGADAYPLDPTRWDGPPPNGGDITPPLVTLTEPSSASLVSVVPIP